jgi:ubiquinone/menaquinone biosynthesis C-methylase UbiE
MEQETMDHQEAGRYWDRNAEAWTRLARAGYDVYRDHVNTPAFLRMLPDVTGLRGLDIGCGEGHNTRLLARRGARVVGIDIAERFIQYAREAERSEPLGIEYEAASAVELPFAAASFDFATAFMSLMDIPESDRALAEAGRVLREGGFLQFSILHPCTDTPHRKNLRDAQRRTYALELGGYFEKGERVIRWLFGAAPPEATAGLEPFATPCFPRTVSEWLNAVIAAGLRIEQVEEPRADDEAVAKCADVRDTRVMPYFLHVRARKP